MLMRLLWTFARVPVELLLGMIPGAPDPASITIPWPAMVPSFVFFTALPIIVGAGGAFLLIRVLRWVYGLIPVVQ